jgi:hypothetical protein
MSTFSKVLLVLTSLWVVGLVLIFAGMHPSPELIGFSVFLVPAAGLTLFVCWFVALLTTRKRAIAFAAMVVIASLSFVALNQGIAIGARVHFYLNRDYYESKVRAVLATADQDERLRICGEECWLLSSDPDRIAFHFAHGFLNWDDLVYDPTHAVETRDYDAKKRLNVYFWSAELICGDWYLAHFGD